MITILRLASYPTLEESGRGLHCYEISKADKTKVIYLTWFKKQCTPFKIPDNVTLHVRKFYTMENPKKSNFIRKGLFNIYRLFRVFTFSINGIYYLNIELMLYIFILQCLLLLAVLDIYLVKKIILLFMVKIFLI